LLHGGVRPSPWRSNVPTHPLRAMAQWASATMTRDKNRKNVKEHCPPPFRPEALQKVSGLPPFPPVLPRPNQKALPYSVEQFRRNLCQPQFFFHKFFLSCPKPTEESICYSWFSKRPGCMRTLPTVRARPPSSSSCSFDSVPNLENRRTGTEDDDDDQNEHEIWLTSRHKTSRGSGFGNGFTFPPVSTHPTAVSFSVFNCCVSLPPPPRIAREFTLSPAAAGRDTLL